MLFLTRIPAAGVVSLRQGCSCAVAGVLNQPSRSNSSSSSPTPPNRRTPLELLQDKLSRGEIRPDPHQNQITEALQKVYDSIQGYEPPKPTGGIGKWFGFKARKAEKVEAPKGLYIYGSVGGGKTMLMDMFYDCCEVSWVGDWWEEQGGVTRGVKCGQNCVNAVWTRDVNRDLRYTAVSNAGFDIFAQSFCT